MQDLNAFALRLLKFIDESIAEAIGNAEERHALLEEAQGALRVLKRTLLREEQTKHAKAVLVSSFDWDLPKMRTEPNPEENLRRAAANIGKMGIVFGAPGWGTA